MVSIASKPCKVCKARKSQLANVLNAFCTLRILCMVIQIVENLLTINY